MDGRALELSDLPAEMIKNEICQWLPLESLLNLRQANEKCRALVDTFIQYDLIKIPLWQILNKDDSHFIYLCNLIKKNPALLLPLRDPEKLLAFCLELKPIGLLRLSIVFSAFMNDAYEPIRNIANSDNDKNWFIAYICCALLTPDINTLDTNILTQAIWWLDSPQHNNIYAAISLCLATIEKVRRVRPYVDIGDLPNKPCYLNLQGGDFSNAKLRRTDLSFANLRSANLSDAELTNAKLYLYDTYIKDASFRDGHLWGAFFFDLSGSKTTLLHQLDMLDYQLSKTETSCRLDEALTEDLIAQISALKIPPIDKYKALQTALNHPFFLNRLDNININIAFTKAIMSLNKPRTTGFFQRPRLSSAWDLTSARLPEPSSKSPQ